MKKLKTWYANRMITASRTTFVIMNVLFHALKFSYHAAIIWLTGLLLVDYFTELPYITIGQAFALSFWVKIILFNLNPKHVKK